MKRNRLCIMAVAFCCNILCLTACAQDHTANEKKLAIANAIAKTTVLLNNQDGIIPLKALEKKNIASVSLGFAYNCMGKLAIPMLRLRGFVSQHCRININQMR